MVDSRSPIYLATFHTLYHDKEAGGLRERSIDLRFRDDGGIKGATMSAIRYYEARHAAEAKWLKGLGESGKDINPHWGRLGCLKMYAVKYGGIDEKGNTEVSCEIEMCFYEWKCDWGVPLGYKLNGGWPGEKH